jgi:hypothetical protein
LLLFYRSLQTLKDDVKAGRTPMRGVNLGGWLVGEHWMTSASPAWGGVPNDVADHGEFKTMQYLGTVHHLFLFISVLYTIYLCLIRSW